MILELIWIEEHLNDYYGGMGRPAKSRAAIARAFIAKMAYNMPTTRMLLPSMPGKGLRRKRPKLNRKPKSVAVQRKAKSVRKQRLTKSRRPTTFNKFTAL